MTDPTDLHDDALHGRLRTLLHDRAATISGPAPSLPTAAIANGSHHRSRWPITAAAAVVLLLAAGTVAVVARPDDGQDRVETTTARTPEDGPVPPSFVLAAAQPVFRLQGEVAPEAVARRYLSWRLTDGSTDRAEVGESLVLEAGAREGDVVPLRWQRADDDASRGTVWVKVGARGSEVLAATTPGVDLSEVAVDGKEISGQVAATDEAPTGEVLIDVWDRGRALPTFTDGPGLPPGPFGYGTTAEGSDPFEVDTGGTGAVVAVRIVDDGAVQAITELHLEAPDPDQPTAEELEGLTGEQLFERLGDPPPDPRCVAVDEQDLPFDEPFPGGSASGPSTPSDDVFDVPLADNPAGAIVELGDALGVVLEQRTITTVDGSTASVGALADGTTPVEVWATQLEGGWKAFDTTTPAACFSSGAGGSSRDGVVTQRSTLPLSQVVGADTGTLWYQLRDGTTRTVTLDNADIARGNVNVDGPFDQILYVAQVLVDAEGNAVLVQRQQTGTL